ncbi:uncharacterized protein LOC124416817 [Diprion similis]|uniref:uncharacterized protein LOC124416817 n=1 Tax=Diprion similis TaxID=362088 RepID=UPI001EF75908|nr:uncharacterized protein LOC124416817 [Diprion similis]
MQKEPKPGALKSNSAKKTRNPGTPENRSRNSSHDVTISALNRTTNFRHRTTMSSNDIMIPPGLVTKRRTGAAARLNMTLAQPPSQVPMKAEPEYPENELSLLYDKYLRATAAEILVKKKIAEKEHAMTDQMVAVSSERQIAKEKAEAAKLRESELRSANVMQGRIDAQMADITACFDDLRKNKVKEKLLDLKTLLEPLDELQCQGIVIPNNPEDSWEFFKSLEDIGEVLKCMRESNGNKESTYRDLADGLKSLTDKHAEIECVKKKFDETLCGLQVLVLKEASASLADSDADVSCNVLAD